MDIDKIKEYATVKVTVLNERLSNTGLKTNRNTNTMELRGVVTSKPVPIRDYIHDQYGKYCYMTTSQLGWAFELACLDSRNTPQIIWVVCSEVDVSPAKIMNYGQQLRHFARTYNELK